MPWCWFGEGGLGGGEGGGVMEGLLALVGGAGGSEGYRYRYRTELGR